MHIDWLNNKITVEEAESRFMDQDNRISPDPVPFGFFNPLWEKLKSNMEEVDEIWQFSSPKDSWINMCGRAGVCIIKDGKITDHIVTAMN